jgi:hypothetical protein
MKKNEPLSKNPFLKNQPVDVAKIPCAGIPRIKNMPTNLQSKRFLGFFAHM